MKHLDKTVKRDHATKRMVFFTALSAYSRNPQNLFLKGPSSTGKTYNVTEALRYFPRSDVWMLGGLSPTALVHDYGTLIDSESGKEIDPAEDKPQKEDYKDDKHGFDRHAFHAAEKRWRDRLRKAYYLVDLQRKILVFLEAPTPRPTCASDPSSATTHRTSATDSPTNPPAPYAPCTWCSKAGRHASSAPPMPTTSRASPPEASPPPPTSTPRNTRPPSRCRAP